MILSHHPPCDYDHTLIIGRLRICTRCFGVGLGVFIVLMSQWIAGVSILTLPKLIPFVLPLPAVIDFTTHELQWWQGNNAIRLIGGFLLGVAVGLYGVTFICGSILLGITQFVWLFALEFGVAALLNKFGRLEVLIERYEQGMWKISKSETIKNHLLH